MNSALEGNFNIIPMPQYDDLNWGDNFMRNMYSILVNKWIENYTYSIYTFLVVVVKSAARLRVAARLLNLWRY